MRLVEKIANGLNWGSKEITDLEGFAPVMNGFITNSTNDSFTGEHTVLYATICRGFSFKIVSGGTLKRVTVHFDGYCVQSNSSACLWSGLYDYDEDGELTTSDIVKASALTSVDLTTTNQSYTLTSTSIEKFIPTSSNSYNFYFGGNKNSFQTFKWYFSNISFDFTYEVPYYMITATAAENGTVTGSGEYEAETAVTLKAIPDKGYKFSHWSDGSTSANRTITATKDLDIEAYFVLDKINNIFLGNFAAG